MSNATLDRQFWCRRCRGWATRVALITALLALFGGCGDYFSEHLLLKLPDQSVTLDSAHPEYRSRFRMEAYGGRYQLNLKFLTATTEAKPTLDLELLDGEVGGESSMTNWHLTRDATSAYGYGVVTVACKTAAPCTADFEVTVGTEPTKAFGPGDSIEGVFSVTAEASQSRASESDGTYLAIETLP